MLHRIRRAVAPGGTQLAQVHATDAQIKHKSQKRSNREALVVLESDSISVLLSLLFVPKDIPVQVLRQIIFQLCATSKSRHFILQALLDIILYTGLSFFTHL
jgi:hypothetical protein